MSQAPAGPLDAEQLRVLANCRALDKKLKWSRGLAQLNVASLGLFAVISVFAGLVELSIPVMGLCMAGLAWNEERGRRLLLLLDSQAARHLAVNQIALLAVILGYCIWNSIGVWMGPDPIAALANGSTEVAQALNQLEGQGLGNTSELGNWVRFATLIVYAAVAVGSILVQGYSAYYYNSRRELIEQLAACPDWARAL